VRWRSVYLLLLGVAVAGVFGAKLYSVIERGGFVWRDLGFELRAGYRDQ